MNKRKTLLPIIHALFASSGRLCLCLVLLTVSSAFGVNTNQVLNVASNSDTNQLANAATGGTNLADMSLDQLMQLQVPSVTTASKFEQKATEAPANATVITSDEIKKYGWRTLGDLLSSVPGFYVSYDRNYQYVGVSGVNLGDANNRILLLVNGHRINDDLDDSAAVDTSFILDMDLIDRVEIIRGPGSVLYGNNAFFAVINVITRRGKQVQGAEGSGTYGSFNEGSGRATVGWQFTNGPEFLLSGTIYNDPGNGNLYYPEFQKYNNGDAHNMDGGNYQSFFGSVDYFDFTLEGGYINRDKVDPTAQYGTSFNDPQLQTIDDRSYAMLKYSHDFAGGWDVLGDVYYDRSDSQIGYPLGASPGAPEEVLYNEQQTGQWAGTEVQVNKKIMDKHTITFGGEYRNDFDQEASEFGPGVMEVIHDHRQNYGIFGQGDFAILDNLRLNAGVRYDEYGTYTPDWSPRAALIYNPWEQSTFKFIYGTAFRDPNLTELQFGGITNVQPEKISSYQLVYEQGINRYLRSSLSGYYNHMNNLIGLNSSGVDANFNADTWGLEPALELKWNEINARLSYSLQRTVNRTTDDSLPDSPQHMVKLNVNAPLYKDKIFAGLEIQYTSRSTTVEEDFTTGHIVSGPDSPGFALVNLTIFSHDLFVKNLQLSASIYNLLNTKYYEPASDYHYEPYIQQDGITFRLKVTYSF
jgi:outer membrane receptor for ferrienterochelin and colicins